MHTSMNMNIATSAHIDTHFDAHFDTHYRSAYAYTVCTAVVQLFSFDVLSMLVHHAYHYVQDSNAQGETANTWYTQHTRL
jgi:hypothetical protein